MSNQGFEDLLSSEESVIGGGFLLSPKLLDWLRKEDKIRFPFPFPRPPFPFPRPSILPPRPHC